MRFGSLFTGIGGMDLGLGRAGMQVAWQCEIDPFCREVLAERFPGVELMEDICDKSIQWPDVDLICGGPPCQPVSVAGRRAGADDARWLWPDFLRVVRSVRPRWVLAENPLGLRGAAGGGLEWVLSELEAAGYGGVVVSMGAADLGAPHRRARLWIVGRRVGGGDVADPHEPRIGDADERRRSSRARWEGAANAGGSCAAGGDVGDADSSRREAFGPGREEYPGGEPQLRGRCRWPTRRGLEQHGWEPRRATPAEPFMGRMLDGFSDRVVRFLGGRLRRERLKALGNAVVPACAEVIGRAILEADGRP